MNRKLWIWVIVAFSAFASIMLGVELMSEHNYKKSILSSRLEGYADIVSRTDDYSRTTSFLPDGIRVTVIGLNGNVVYDSFESADALSNHLSRPEIAACLEGKDGCSIRKSETLGIEYIYYARRYDGVIIRTALPFEINQKRFMHPDRMLLFTILLLFAATVMVIILISRRINDEVDRETNQKLQNQKKQMTNNIAHELRTPVTSIRGYLETLVNNPDMPAERKELFMEKAYLQTLRLSELIRDISLITKIEEAPELLSKGTVVIRKMTDDVTEELSEALKGQNITVDNTIPENVTVNGNATLIYAIFKNFVENTIRYAGSGVTISMSYRGESDGKAVFQYSDNGKGVAEDQLDRIFERFFRISSEDSHKAEGSGLGLSIVRNAIAFHGGTVKASTFLHHGLMFTFSIGRD